MRSFFKPALILVIGVLAMSSASIFIRLAMAEGVPPLVIAAYRLSIASIVVTVFAARERAWVDYVKLGRNERIYVLGSGALLALHFAAWITSLEYTSVLSSVVIVSTTPLWIGLMSPFLLKETINRTTWLGLVAAVSGCIFVGLADAGGVHDKAELGNVLALSGAVAGAGYLMIGRLMRNSIRFTAYLWGVYATAAIILVIWSLGKQEPLVGYGWRSTVWLIALGLIPQIIGHGAANYVVRHLSATFVGIGTLGEPVGSTLLAMAVLNEWPQPIQIIGAAGIITGIGIASRGEQLRSGKQLTANDHN